MYQPLMYINKPVRKVSKKRKHVEDTEQTLLYLWWRSAILPKYRKCLFHIPNGGKREKKLIKNNDGTQRWVCLDGKRLKSQGVETGVSDNFLMIPAYGLSGLWIEMKARKTQDYKARPSQEQNEFLDLAHEMGYGVKISYGYLEAKQAILEYLIGTPRQNIFKKNAVDWEAIRNPHK